MKSYKTYLTFSLVFLMTTVMALPANDSIAKSLNLYVFPNEGQDQEQQEYDEFQCYKWAKSETEVDPINLPDYEPEAVDTGRDGSAVRGAARGAAAGAAIGAIAGDAGKGAAIGATAGGMRGARRNAYNNAQKEQQAEQAAQEAKAEDLSNFSKAFCACMEAKDYTVK